MGTNISKQCTQSITGIVNESLTQISTNINNGVSTHIKSTQRINIRISGSAHFDTLNLNQTLSSSSTSILKADTNMMNDIANTMTTKIKEELSTQLKQVNKDLNLGQTNVGVQETVSATFISNIIKTSMNQTINNMVTTTSDNIQEVNLIIDEKTSGSVINITQKQEIEVISQNLASNIVANVLKNLTTSDIDKQIKLAADQLNSGIDVFGIFMIIGLIVLVIGGVYFSLKSGGAKSISSDIAEGMKDIKGLDKTVGGAYNSLQKKRAAGVALGGVMVAAGFYQFYHKPAKQKVKDDYGI
jgi:hypothetical protein